METGLKQGDALSPVLFNLALEKAIRELQKETTGIEINQQKIQILGFADDLNIIGNTRDDTEKAAKVLEIAAEKLGLKINTEKTKIMELLDMNTDFTDSDSNESIYEKVNEFKYLGVCINTKNDWSQEIGVRIIKAGKASFALFKFFKNKMLSKKTKVRLYTVIVRAILTYGCEAWTTTSVTERRLTTFENKIWRMICEPKLDENTGMWRRKFNKELIEETEMTPIKYYIRGQRIQWFGHIMREGNDKITKTVPSWKPTGKRPRGRPRKRRMDVVEEDLKRIGILGLEKYST